MEANVYRDIFGGRCHLAVALHHGPGDAAALDHALHTARQCRMPLLATNDVHYHVPERRLLHDVVTAVRHGVNVADLGDRRFPNGERHLKSAAQMARLFQACPEAVARTVELAQRCTFSLDELRYEYPEELAPPGLTPFEHLTHLTWAGARERFPAGIPDKVKLERELVLIQELRYEAFFLTVWDIVRFARSQGILCQGRGSAANSAVCYCLGITSVDPDRTDLLFERFISRERNEPPDIDVDFEHERREEVFRYIYGKYGRERAGIVAEVISYRPRSAVRDVGKALGMSLDCVERMAKSFDPYANGSDLEGRARAAGLDPRSPATQHLTRLATEILGFPRHLSQHVGGFVITRGPLAELVPIENAAMPERTVIEWNKDDVDALGILKVDCLSLGMLTAIRKCFDLVARHHDRQLTLATLPAEDAVVYDMICRADTVGVFQIESRAQMSMLPRLKPRTFYDLVIEVAIIRPGPIQGKMVHPYLRRRHGEEAVTYPDPAIEQVLAKTLGVPLFQEQVMRLAMVAAGFTAGEADQLRRAMGVWHKQGAMEKFRDKIRAGMLARGLPGEFADQLFEQIRGFGSYGFPEAHAASFALLAYVSAWLKCHYPVAYAAAILNSQPMGFYAPAQIVRDLQEHGGQALPVDVNFSEWDCTLEDARSQRSEVRSQRSEVRSQRSEVRGQRSEVRGQRSEVRGQGSEVRGQGSEVRGQKSEVRGQGSEVRGQKLYLRLGFRLIRGFPEAAGPAIVATRSERVFRSIGDFARRTSLGRPLLAKLAAADAFGSLGLSRREALWHVLSLGEELPLFAGLEDDEPACLPAMSLEKHVVADYGSVGLSLKAHPMSLVRDVLDGDVSVGLHIAHAKQLEQIADKTLVRVAGLVITRQMPSTAKGTVFMTLEDETGVVNLVVWPRVWDRFRRVAYGSVAVLCEGKLERSSGVIHVIANKFHDLSQYLRGLDNRARDFH